MISQTKNLLRMSAQEAKAEVEEAVNSILDCVQNRLSDKPEIAKEMY